MSYWLAQVVLCFVLDELNILDQQAQHGDLHLAIGGKFEEKKMIRLILNGKKAGLPEVRTAISKLRTQGHTVEVRVTWEHGDLHRLVREAAKEGIPRVVAAGGDGTVNTDYHSKNAP